MHARQGRVAEAIRTELADLLENKIRDPKKGFLTITEVDLSRDLKIAKVFISVLGSDEEKKDNFRLLTRARGFLRSELAKRIPLRVTPEIRFFEDRSAERGARIDTILRELSEAKPAEGERAPEEGERTSLEEDDGEGS